MGYVECGFHTKSLLSFPPEQSCCSSNDHLRPHTYCLCPISLLVKGVLVRISRCKIVLSLEPVLRRLELHEIAPTLLVCPSNVLIFLILFASHICTYPELVPTANMGPFNDHDTDVAVSDIPKSHNLDTFELLAFHMYTLEAKPTAK